MSLVEPPVGAEVETYSTREREVISGLAAGQSVKEIATRMGVTANTVKDYLKTVYAKARVHSARELLVHLYGVPQIENANAGGTRLLPVVEKLLSGTHQQEVLRHLVDGLREIVHAEHVTVWRWAETQAESVLIPIIGGEYSDARCLHFLRDAVERGIAQFRATNPEEHQALTTLGVGRQAVAISMPVPLRATLGARRDLPSGPTLILMSKPDAVPFLPLEVSTAHMLARLAAVQCGGKVRRESPVVA